MANQLTSVAVVVMPVSTDVTSRLPSSRNRVRTPPIRIPTMTATLLVRIRHFIRDLIDIAKVYLSTVVLAVVKYLKEVIMLALLLSRAQR